MVNIYFLKLFKILRKSACTKSGEMSAKARRAHRRYFVNNLNDVGTLPPIDTTFLKTEIHSKALLCFNEQPYADHSSHDGGLYVGVSGIAYMFYHISKSDSFKNEKRELTKKCLDIIKECLEKIEKGRKHQNDTDRCAFLLGNAGVYAVGAAILNYSGDTSHAEHCIHEYIRIASICSPLSYARFGGDELLVGRAGYLSGALWLNKEFKKKIIPDEIINGICKSMMASGKKYSERKNSPCPLMYSYHGTEYLGAAHGLCGILQMLLSCDTFLEGNKAEEEVIKQSVDYFLSLQTSSGNFPCAMDEIGRNARTEEDETIHWCHGAPGAVYLMAKAYLRWKDDKYLQSALQCGEVTWRKGLLKKGPGICHGVAGNGYVFLLLYRLTQDVKHLHRAYEFAKFMSDSKFLEEARTPDMPYSLYEGYAGTVCFLTDVMEPSNSAFPFMDVF